MDNDIVTVRPISLLDNRILKVTKSATIKDLGQFAERSSKHRAFIFEPFLYDIGDCGDWGVMEKFKKLLDEESEMTIYGFFKEYGLLRDSEDMKVFFHIEFC